MFRVRPSTVGQMPELQNTRCVLAVPEFRAAIDFFVKQLGMQVDFEAPGWAFLSRGAFRLMLGECPDALSPAELGDHSYFVYVNVSEVDKLHAEFAARGVDILQALADKPWGMREFGIRTPQGHRLMFGEELA